MFAKNDVKLKYPMYTRENLPGVIFVPVEVIESSFNDIEYNSKNILCDESGE